MPTLNNQPGKDERTRQHTRRAKSQLSAHASGVEQRPRITGQNCTALDSKYRNDSDQKREQPHRQCVDCLKRPFKPQH